MKYLDVTTDEGTLRMKPVDPGAQIPEELYESFGQTLFPEYVPGGGFRTMVYPADQTIEDIKAGSLRNGVEIRLIERPAKL